MVSFSARATLATATVISHSRRVLGVRHRLGLNLGHRRAIRLIMTRPLPRRPVHELDDDAVRIGDLEEALAPFLDG
jgi:hypothetical protein